MPRQPGLGPRTNGACPQTRLFYNLEKSESSSSLHPHHLRKLQSCTALQQAKPQAAKKSRKLDQSSLPCNHEVYLSLFTVHPNKNTAGLTRTYRQADQESAQGDLRSSDRQLCGHLRSHQRQSPLLHRQTENHERKRWQRYPEQQDHHS